MTTRSRTRALRIMVAIAAIPLSAGGPSDSLAAQDKHSDMRIGKLEAQIRALRREVFHDDGQKSFAPEIRIAPKAGPLPGRPATTPMNDMTARAGLVGTQLGRLTTQIERNRNQLERLEDRVSAIGEPVSASMGKRQTREPTASRGQAAQDRKTSVTHSDLRKSAVQAIVKPSTNDPGDDEYSYGFRLWNAKFYPEAQAQLKQVIKQYPNHKRISFARNLLGRAFLDDGQSREAAKWFLQNYVSQRRGPRAADSLLYLADALDRLGDKKRACIALAEFLRVYPNEATLRLKSLYGSTKAKLNCN